jgi:hypothetical protein
MRRMDSEFQLAVMFVLVGAIWFAAVVVGWWLFSRH